MTGALIAIQSVLSGLETAIAGTQILGEKEVVVTPTMQMSVGKIPGEALSSSVQSVGGSSIKFPNNTQYSGCAVLKVHRLAIVLQHNCGIHVLLEHKNNFLH